MAVTRKRRSAPAKNAFVERLQAEARSELAIDAEPHDEHNVVTFSSSRGKPWTKETAPPLPVSMRDDPLSAYLNSMNLWMLMATGWCEIVRASWGLD